LKNKEKKNRKPEEKQFVVETATREQQLELDLMPQGI